MALSADAGVAAPGAVTATTSVGGATGGAVSATRLRCEWLDEPLGIDAESPRLSWTPVAGRRDEKPTAYQIVAAVAGPGRRARWDTGKVVSGAIGAPWAGPPLASRDRVEWKVRLWDRDGRPSPWSAPATFELGLLRPEDWRARWIAAQARLDRLPPMPLVGNETRFIAAPEAGGSAGAGDAGRQVFRTTFPVPRWGRKIRHAVAVVGADGPFVASLNGQIFARGEGPAWLEPAAVQPLLRRGETNVLAIALDAGRAAAAGRRDPAVVARLDLEFEDKRIVTIATGRGWKTAAAPAVGWHDAAFDDRGWRPVRDVTGDGPAARRPARLAARAEPAPYLRREFIVKRPVRRARAYVTGLGYFELYLNGQKVGDHILDPVYTAYHRRVAYVVHDVTALLRPGPNAVGAILGNGFFNQHAQDVWDFHDATWRATPRLLAQLEIEYADGARELVASDEGWRAGEGPLRFDGIRNGEIYDARMERPGWSEPGFVEDTSWRPVVAVAAPAGALVAQAMPPMKVTEIVPAQSVREPRPGVHVFDLGVNIAGVVRLKASAPRGAAITLVHGESLAKDGAVDPGGGSLVLQGPFQTDTYVAKGGGIETWQPRFTYHGFRYVEVRGLPARPALDAVTGLVVHTAFEPVGELATSDERLNRIQAATLRSFRGNYHGIPTDCPHREKNGWTGDAHWAAEQAMFNFDNVAGYEKWIRDMADAQREDGAFPAIVPTGGWGFFYGNGPAWDSAFFIIPSLVHRFTGDARLLISQRDGMARYLELVGQHDYLTHSPYGWLGDWSIPRSSTPESVTHAKFHVEDARVAALAARLAAVATDETRYLELARETARRFRERFVDGAAGRVATDTQTARACALASGLVAGADAERIRAALLADLRKNGDRLDVGVLGLPCLLDVLTDAGEVDLALRAILHPEGPSFARMIADDAGGTLWEGWDGRGSRNHVFFGSVSAFFWKALAGLNPAADAPGWEAFSIRPHVAGGLSFVRASTRQARGRVASAWRVEDGSLTLEIEVPVGATATVAVPAPDGATVTVSPAGAARPAPGGEAGARGGGLRRAAYTVGSGATIFVVRPFPGGAQKR